MLPAEVMARAGDEMLDWHGSGMSIMEMSHRGKEFISVYEEAERDLRELLGVPANYRILFLQGGATLQFAQIPMNLLRGKGKADYVLTGEWSKKAIKEAKAYCDVHIAASSEDKNFTYAPKTFSTRKDSAYVHYCSNETIGGVEYHPHEEVPGLDVAELLGVENVLPVMGKERRHRGYDSGAVRAGKCQDELMIGHGGCD